MKKTHRQKPNKAMMRREDRLKDRPQKTGAMSLHEWQRRQRVIAEMHEAQNAYDKVLKDMERYAKVKKAASVSSEAGKAEL